MNHFLCKSSLWENAGRPVVFTAKTLHNNNKKMLKEKRIRIKSDNILARYILTENIMSLISQIFYGGYVELDFTF